MQLVKYMTNMWKYKEGYIQRNGNSEWIGLDSNEQTIVRRSSMADVKSALDNIFK